MASNNISVTVDLEPIVKIVCFATTCKNNLLPAGFLACNLKHIEIAEQGRCKQFELSKSKQEKYEPRETEGSA